MTATHTDITVGCRAAAVAEAIAERLASPAEARALSLINGWLPQSLAYGAAGVALLHIDRARAGLGSWQRVHDWLACATHDPVLTGDNSHLFYGAPAIAYALNIAATEQPGRYVRALDELDRHITTSTRRRLAHAHTRADRHGRPALAEFDAMRGLTGIGAHLRHRKPLQDLLQEVLAYLVRLTEPLGNDGGAGLPGWWSDQAPSGRISDRFPGGHANNGMAHGISGPLALLALAMRDGIIVDGHREAITRIVAWLDDWRHTDSRSGATWPYWITPHHLNARAPEQSARSRPSWCYGAAGIARAQQLAAIAIHDTTRQHDAEATLLAALTDPGSLATITDLSLCHGFAGLVQIAARAATDATTPDISACLPGLVAEIVPAGTDRWELAGSLLGDIGLLDGATGVALALQSTLPTTGSRSGWDSCFLIT